MGAVSQSDPATTAASVSESDSAGPKPAIATGIASSDFIGTYADYADVFELPRKAHESVAILLIASILNRRVLIPWGAATHPLDFWMLLLSPSGQGRNTATDVALRIIDQADIDGLIRSGSWGSAPAFYQQLAEHPTGLYVWPELSVVLRTLKDPRFGGVKEWFTDRYDNLRTPPCIVYRQTGKSQDTPAIIFNEAPRINVLATSSRDWFINCLEQEDTTGGFVPRWVIVSLQDSGRVLSKPLAASCGLVRALADKLKGIDELRGNADLSAVEGIYDQWYRFARKRFENQPNPALAMPFFNRLRGHVLKLAVIFEVSQSQSLKVSENAMHRAIEFARETEKTVFEILPTGMNRVGAEVEKMSELIRKAGPAGILQSKLTSALKHWKAREREERLHTLLESETVYRFGRSTPGRKARVYVYRDHFKRHQEEFRNDDLWPVE
jgi:hypothetical protein